MGSRVLTANAQLPWPDKGTNMIDVLTIFAWAVIAVLLLAVIGAIVALGSLPGKIATKRNHPQTDAINAASWIGLAFGGIGWPFAFVWAFLKSGPAGSGDTPANSSPSRSGEIARLEVRISELELAMATKNAQGKKSK